MKENSEKLLKILFLSLSIIIGNLSISFSQTISQEEIDKAIKKDSITFSWEKANEFVNGLENEIKLDTVYRRLLRENASLNMSYSSLERKLISYEDTIVPAYKEVIKNKDANFMQLEQVCDSCDRQLKKQGFLLKFVLIPAAVVLGFIIGSI